MNKKELVKALADKAKVSQADASTILNAFTDVVTEQLSKGEEVALVGFGSFKAKDMPEHTARNPQTGETMTVAACRKPVFKPGAMLKAAVK